MQRDQRERKKTREGETGGERGENVEAGRVFVVSGPEMYSQVRRDVYSCELKRVYMREVASIDRP